MENKHVFTDEMNIYENLIMKITNKYEPGESFWILYGLEIVGVKNAKFWLNFVEYIKKSKGLEKLEIYITLMKKISRRDLLRILENITNENMYKTFEETYLVFINLLSKVSDVVLVNETNEMYKMK